MRLFITYSACRSEDRCHPRLIRHCDIVDAQMLRREEDEDGPDFERMQQSYDTSVAPEAREASTAVIADYRLHQNYF
jgi:hypothetical protein